MIRARRARRGGAPAARVSRVALVLMSLAGTVLVSAQAASADVTTISSDTSRVGWQQNQPGLGPSNLPSINQQFSSPVSGSVYAQPLVVGSNVIVATENNMVYGIDRNTGDAKWATSVGRPGSSLDFKNCMRG